MPIRFVCNHCGQKLSVGSHKAGQKANCPRCKESVRVPGEANKPGRDVAASMLVIAGEPEMSAPEEPFAPPVANEQSPLETSELVFDTSSSTIADANPEPSVVQRTDYNLVSFPRYVLYAQAGLIAGVAIVCFTLGALMGAAFSGGADGPAAAKPCTISGYVQVTEGVTKKGDEGAVIILLPQDVQKIEERSPVEGMRPRDPVPAETHRGLLLLKNHGGGYGRANKEGKYQVRVPRQGKYYMIVISKTKTGAADNVDAFHKLKIASFFENANDLIGSQKYRFTEEKFLADRKIDVSFE
jgi:hypothetical protein